MKLYTNEGLSSNDFDKLYFSKSGIVTLRESFFEQQPEFLS